MILQILLPHLLQVIGYGMLVQLCQPHYHKGTQITNIISIFSFIQRSFGFYIIFIRFLLQLVSWQCMQQCYEEIYHLSGMRVSRTDNLCPIFCKRILIDICHLMYAFLEEIFYDLYSLVVLMKYRSTILVKICTHSILALHVGGGIFPVALMHLFILSSWIRLTQFKWTIWQLGCAYCIDGQD